MEIDVKIRIEYETFENLFVNAWCGGSTYWAAIDSSEYEDNFSKNNPNTTTDAKTAWELWNNPDFHVNVYDAEEEETILGVLNQDKIQLAFQIMIDQHPSDWAAVISENDDASDADTFFQLFTMSEVIYG